MATPSDQPAAAAVPLVPIIPVSSAYIPDNKPPRTIVLCFDGTGDQFDLDNSNVVQLFSMLKKDDKHEQLVYYQAGIGTYTNPGIFTPVMSALSKTVDEMIAWNLDAHVMGGYEFLMQNYEAGDKICLFGFSRGAYTARALAGMIHKVGLLPAFNHNQVPFAYKMFTKADALGWQQSTAFKKAFCIDVDIEFIGVWDTVCSVGIIPRRLPFTSSNTAIKTFRHAVSLDERRAKFKANLFNRPTKEEALLGTQPGEMPKSTSDVPADPTSPSTDYIGSALRKTINSDQLNGKKRKESEWRTLEREFSSSDKDNHETDVLEVWFSGCHCDVGGGSVPNSERHNLARIPLRWMIRQCFLTKCGIRFHTDLLKTVGLDPDSLWPEVRPRPPPLTNADVAAVEQLSAASILPMTTGTHNRTDTSTTLINYADAPPALTIGGIVIPRLTEEQEDLLDLRSKVYDQLSLKLSWWVLELLPFQQKEQQEDDSWDANLCINFGRGREVPERVQRHAFLVHRSVKTRMEATDLSQGIYKPKAQFRVVPTWVD